MKTFIYVAFLIVMTSCVTKPKRTSSQEHQKSVDSSSNAIFESEFDESITVISKSFNTLDSISSPIETYVKQNILTKEEQRKNNSLNGLEIGKDIFSHLGVKQLIADSKSSDVEILVSSNPSKIKLPSGHKIQIKYHRRDGNSYLAFRLGAQEAVREYVIFERSRSNGKDVAKLYFDEYVSFLNTLRSDYKLDMRSAITGEVIIESRGGIVQYNGAVKWNLDHVDLNIDSFFAELKLSDKKILSAQCKVSVFDNKQQKQIGYVDFKGTDIGSSQEDVQLKYALDLEK